MSIWSSLPPHDLLAYTVGYSEETEDQEINVDVATARDYGEGGLIRLALFDEGGVGVDECMLTPAMAQVVAEKLVSAAAICNAVER